MHEAALARAALPAPTEVLGMMLRPYSLGHELYLLRENAQSVQSSKPKAQSPEAWRASLMRAVLICCESWEGAGRMKSDWMLGLKLRAWGWRLRGVDWKAEAVKFAAYRKEGALEFPLSDMRVTGAKQSPMPPGCPFLLQLHLFLAQELRLSQAEAWNFPLGLAKMLWAAHWESRGGLQIYSWADAEHDDFVAKCEEEESLESLKSKAQSPKSGAEELAAVQHILRVQEEGQSAVTEKGGCLA